MEPLVWTVGAHLIPLPLLAESALIEFCLLSDWQRLAKQGSKGWFGFFPLIRTANNFKDTPAFFLWKHVVTFSTWHRVWLVWLASHLPIFGYLMSSSIAANFNFLAEVCAKD